MPAQVPARTRMGQPAVLDEEPELVDEEPEPGALGQVWVEGVVVEPDDGVVVAVDPDDVEPVEVEVTAACVKMFEEAAAAPVAAEATPYPPRASPAASALPATSLVISFCVSCIIVLLVVSLSCEAAGRGDRRR